MAKVGPKLCVVACEADDGFAQVIQAELSETGFAVEGHSSSCKVGRPCVVVLSAAALTSDVWRSGFEHHAAGRLIPVRYGDPLTDPALAGRVPEVLRALNWLPWNPMDPQGVLQGVERPSSNRSCLAG